MTETSLKNVTLTMISTSVTQMLRSSVVVFSALLALIFLKKKLYRHHVTSIGIIVTGIFLGGLSQVLSSSKEVLLKPIGVIIVLVAQLFGATGYVVEEKFLGDFDDVDPIYLIGIEGLWSLLIWCIILPILQIIPCENPDLCPFGRPENTL
jgi:drug/metabolite transporter (DMT)-like permease